MQVAHLLKPAITHSKLSSQFSPPRLLLFLSGPWVHRLEYSFTQTARSVTNKQEKGDKRKKTRARRKKRSRRTRGSE